METHSLLIVQVGISADTLLAPLKKKCKDIVSFFHHSAKATDKLREVQKQLGISEGKLIQEVDTRWNSTLYMFQRIIEQQQAVTTTLCLQGRNELCLSMMHPLVSTKSLLLKCVNVLSTWKKMVSLPSRPS